MKKICLLLAVFGLSLLNSQAQIVDTVLNRTSDKPFYFSVPVADGNYKVTVTDISISLRWATVSTAT